MYITSYFTPVGNIRFPWSQLDPVVYTNLILISHFLIITVCLHPGLLQILITLDWSLPAKDIIRCHACELLE